MGSSGLTWLTKKLTLRSLSTGRVQKVMNGGVAARGAAPDSKIELMQ